MLQYFVVPESDDANSLCGQRSGSRIVVACLIRMLASIQFDHEPPLVTIKVRDVLFVIDNYGVLATKLVTRENTVANESPKQGLGIGLAVA